MSDTQKNKKPNVPNLRFPGFEGEWKSRKIGEDCSVLMCKRIFANQTSEHGDVPFYKIGTIGEEPDAYISREIFEDYKAKYNYPRKGEVMVTCAGTVGKTIVFNGDDSYYQDSNIVWLSNPKQLYLNSFLNYYLSRVNWNKLNSTTITRIYNDNLRELIIKYPSIEEQEKIVSLLSLLDQRIAVQNKVIERYESLIKALYRHVMTMVRGDSIRLGDVVEIQKGKQINNEILSSTGPYYVMNGGITPSGYHTQFNTEANTISISEGGNSCGYVQFNEKPFWSGGHCYSLLHPSTLIDYKFLFHSLKCHQDGIMALRIGSGLPNIQKKDIESFQITLPSLDEQKRYASLFDVLTSRRDMAGKIRTNYEIKRKFLIHNLFI